jgi:hypothetical protein
MGTAAIVVFGLAIAALVVSTVSLLAKNEGFRGAGRVALAVSLLAFGVFLLDISRVAELGNIFYGGLVVLGCGAITLASGVRKYIRRNTAQ